VTKYGRRRVVIRWVVASAITRSGMATRQRTWTPKCSKSGSATSAPSWVEYVTELPKTATGKIQRYKLRV
jgi:acyl-coenzyme A synthetase/AMP-(fatty) acid ligase